VPGLRRRHCSGNASTTRENGHETPAALTAKTSESGLELRRIFARAVIIAGNVSWPCLPCDLRAHWPAESC